MRKREWIQAVVFLVICSLLFANCDSTVPVEPEQCSFPFDTFPGNVPFEGDTPNISGTWQSITADEFLEWGFLVDTYPMQGCAIVQTNFYSSTNNYLAANTDISCRDANRIEFKFQNPIREVALTFSGASISYVMEVYDQDGNLLGAPTQMAEFAEDGPLFNISFKSDQANISMIRFGYQSTERAVIAIRQIDMCDQDEAYTPDWFTDRCNLAHIASNPGSISVPLMERWHVNLGSGIRSSVVGAFDKIYIGADDNKLYALSPRDGSIQWAHQVNGKVSSTATVISVTGGDSEKIISKYIWFVAEDGNLYALDAGTGTMRWTLPGGIGTFNSATNYASDIIYYNYMSTGVTSNIRAVNGLTGDIIWESKLFNITTTSPMIGEGQIFQGITQGGTVYRSYHPVNGVINWEIQESGRLAAAHTSGVMDYDTEIGEQIRVYTSVSGGTIRAIGTSNGQTFWETELPGNGFVTGLALTQEREQNILIVSQTADLYALVPQTGDIIWHTQHSGNVIDPTTRNTPMPAIYGDYVFHVENGINLVARDLEDGSKVWEVELDSSTVSSPTVGGHSVYIASGSGMVYAFSSE